MNEGDDRWLERHGLTRDPFPESDIAVEFFARGGRERQLDTLADPAKLQRPLIAVVGDAGVGKSTLFHSLLKKLPEDIHVARVTAGIFLSAKSLLAALARSIGADVDADASRPELRRVVRARLNAILASGAQCIVMVDDAGELEADALDELVQVAELDPEAARVRVILFALPGIRDALGKAAGGHRVGPLLHEMMIERYSLNELRGYLQFRLARAGLTGPSPFSEDEYAEIFRRSGGIPARANGIAGRLLKAESSGAPKRIYFIAGGVAAALVLAGALILLFGSGEAPTNQVEVQAPTITPAPALEALPTPAIGIAMDNMDKPGSAPASRGADAGLAADTSGAASLGVAAVASVPEAPVLDPQQAREAGAWLGDPVASPRPVAERTVARPAQTSTAQLRPEPGPVVAPTQEPRAPAAVAAPTAAAPPDDQRQALLAMNPDHYLLQLLVNSTATRARSWIAKQQDQEGFRYFERMRAGELQYVVTYGDFAVRVEAARAAERVAQATGIEAPWVRKVADVQGELAAQ